MDMTKNVIQESNFTYSKDRNGKFVAHKTHMPFIKCYCGFKILVVPDLKAMNRAIKNHVAEHNKSSSEKFADYLAEQTLIVTSKISPA